MTRKQGLVIIKTEVARTGVMGKESIRAYLEGKIGRYSMDKTAKEGLKLFNLAKTNVEVKKYVEGERNEK